MKKIPVARLLLFSFLNISLSVMRITAQDPPTIAGTISSASGDAQFSPSESENQFAKATPNSTLTAGNILLTGDGSTMDISIGATAVRLNEQSQIELYSVDEHKIQFAMDRGDIYVRVKSSVPGNTFEIGTEQASIVLNSPGRYRIQVFPDRNLTVLAVREGDSDVTGRDDNGNGGGPQSVRAPQGVTITGTHSAQLEVGRAISADAFEQLCDRNDQTYAKQPTVCSDAMTGCEKLANYGKTEERPPYGEVWRPTGVDSSWAPYQNGQWAWVDPWGWTWVDAAPWGFVTTHYGRWVHLHDGWAWIPGPASDGAVYSPALVAFVEPPGSSGPSSDTAAWFPLGPGEVYTPGYPASSAYWTKVNSSNTLLSANVDIQSIFTQTSGGQRPEQFQQSYSNRQVRGAVTMERREAFVSGVWTSRRDTLSKKEIRTARVLGSNPGIVPTRQSIFQSSSMAQSRPFAVSRPVVLRHSPPPAPLAFSQKQQAISANGGRPLDSQMTGLIRQRQSSGRQQSSPRFVRASSSKTGTIDRSTSKYVFTHGNSSRSTPSNSGGAAPFTKSNSASHPADMNSNGGNRASFKPGYVAPDSSPTTNVGGLHNNPNGTNIPSRPNTGSGAPIRQNTANSTMQRRQQPATQQQQRPVAQQQQRPVPQQQPRPQATRTPPPAKQPVRPTRTNQ